MSLNSHWGFGDILLLSSNDRICSFNWIRGSKHCFLTSFSNFYRYFLFLVFLRHRYLLVSLHLSWLRGTPISCPFFIPFVLRILRCTCTPMFLAHITGFLEVRRSWEPGTRVSTGILSPFCLFFRRFLVRASFGRSRIIPFLSSKSSNWHFHTWHKPPLSQCSRAQDWNLQGISNLVNKVDCCLSEDSCRMTSQVLFTPDLIPAGSLHFIPFDSADLPCYEILCSGFLNGPLPYGTLLEVSPEERRTSIGCSTRLPRSALGVMRVSQGWLLNIPFLAVILFFWDPEASAPDDKLERSLLEEMLEVLFAWLLQKRDK
jgi:hypothetical protein